MSYQIDTSFDLFVEQLQPGDVLAYDTMTPQGGLIQFADRRNVSHVAIYVGDHKIVDASSRKPKDPNEKQRPVRHLVLRSQFPLQRDEGAQDTVTANRSLIALRHTAFEGTDRGLQAAKTALDMFENQRPGPDDDEWRFSPNDLLVLTLPVLVRSFETAYRHASFVGDMSTLICRTLGLLEVMFDPRRTDFRPGVTCSELVHRVLSHPDVGAPLTPGHDGRPSLRRYVERTRSWLERFRCQFDVAGYLDLLDWHASVDRRQQLVDVADLVLLTEPGYDDSDLVTPGDFLGYPELTPLRGYALPIRSESGVPQ